MFSMPSSQTLAQQLLSSSTVRSMKMEARSDVRTSTYFTGSNEEEPQRPSIPDDGFVLSRVRNCAPPRQHQPFAGSRKTARQYITAVQVKSRRRSVKPSVHSSLSLCYTHSAPMNLRVFRHQFWVQSIPRSPVILVRFVALLIC